MKRLEQRGPGSGNCPQGLATPIDRWIGALQGATGQAPQAPVAALQLALEALAAKGISANYEIRAPLKTIGHPQGRTTGAKN
ncbi:MAG: hypothetical protein EBU30_11340 [Synechococcaceae bacterium WB6_3B_236]|nr:hypothetical protein [Synechococcaceae bacterium WB6_3B_236]